MQFPLFANNCWNKQNQDTYPWWPLLYFYCSFETLQYFGVKTFPALDMKRCYLQKNICATVRDLKKPLFMNYIVTLAFTRKILNFNFQVAGSIKMKPSKAKIFLWKFIPTLSYTIAKKSKRVNLPRKSHWGSWSSLEAATGGVL